MSTIINATTTNGVVIQPDNSGSLVLQTNNGTTALTIDTSQRAAFVAGTDALPAITTTGDTNTGMWFPAADTIAFAEGGTESMRIDSSGNVGIGTSSPAAKLHLFGSGTSGYAVFQGPDANQWMTLGGNFNEPVIGYTSTGALRFGTTTDTTFGGFTERMRIDSSGNVRIGTTAGIGSEKLTVTNSASAEAVFFVNSNATPYGVTTYYSAATPNNTTSAFYTASDGTTRFQVRSNGGIANYSANNVNLSDQREKTNIELASSYLDKICSIPVKTFNYIDQNMEEDNGLTLGVIAQDVQAVAPELVTESNWGTEEEPKERLSIYQTDLQYALMKCIQEQQTIINDLKARIETLEAK